jgi:hypothetical protein
MTNIDIFTTMRTSDLIWHASVWSRGVEEQLKKTLRGNTGHDVITEYEFRRITQAYNGFNV